MGVFSESANSRIISNYYSDILLEADGAYMSESVWHGYKNDGKRDANREKELRMQTLPFPCPKSHGGSMILN
jgi:hypothetical protein